MSGFRPQLDPKTTFSQDPAVSLFDRPAPRDEKYLAETFEVPFDTTPVLGQTARCTIPPKTEAIRRITVRSELPELYTPIGSGYVYPSYSDQVDGGVYVLPDTLAIQPGDFVGYFNTQQLNYWATNFTGYTLSVAYDATRNKFVFTSGSYSSIFFKNEGSASFWGFDIRTFDFITAGGYWGYNITGGTLTAPLTLVQAGWIRGFTPPPTSGFSYVDSVGTKLIKEARLLVGGQTIDRLTSERLYLEQDLGLAYENQAGLTILEGKNDTSGVYAPREYYTKLTFNTADTLNIGQLERHDVQVEVDFEEFENLPSNLITTNSLTDPASYSIMDIHTKVLTTYIYHTISYKNYLIMTTESFVYFYNTLTSTFTKSVNLGGFTPRPYITDGYMYFVTNSDRLRRIKVDDMLAGGGTVETGPTLTQIYGAPYSTSIRDIISDARYVYMNIDISKLFSINSNNCVIVSTSPTGRLYLTSFTVTYDVPGITTTPYLTASDNTAFLTYLTNYTINYPPWLATKTVSIQSETKVGSTVTVVGLVSYTLVPPDQTSVPIWEVEGFLLTPSVTLSGSNVATLVSTNPTPLAYSNVQCNLRFYNYPAGSLSASDQTALQTLVLNQTGGTIYSGETRTYSLISQGVSGSDLLVTANVSYAFSNGQPAPHVWENPFGYFNSHGWIRYDSTKTFTSASSYDFCALSGSTNSSPLTSHDVTGGYAFSVTTFSATSDGRYIFTTNPFTKTDTQNFLSVSAYSGLTTVLSPYPFLGGYLETPNPSDGKYLYFSGTYTLGTYSNAYFLQNDTLTISRFDTSKDVNSQSAWEFLSFSIPNPGWVDAPAPLAFDGKYIYYSFVSGPDINTILFGLIRIDTTTYKLADWIYYLQDGTIRTSNGPNVSKITFFHSESPTPTQYPSFGGSPQIHVGSRYIYASGKIINSSATQNNFITLDPLTMTPSFDASVLVKYEKYDQPRQFTKSLLSQTDVNEFVIPSGQTVGNFQLEFSGPIRELWISPDAPALVSRVTFRLNNEILIDDDRPVAGVVRAYESHSNMPTGNLYMYNFALDPETMVPSGTLNFSRINYPMLEIKLTSAAASNTKIRVYAKNFNVFETNAGLGGLAFSSTT